MGTNYYIYMNPCPKCGRADEEYHIGKSSGGWCFSLHVDPARGINDLEDIKRFWKGKIIKDEYDSRITQKKMLAIITKRFWVIGGSVPIDYPTWEQFHKENHSEPGPKNLLRHKIEKGHCIGHGKGTWDLIVGEFS